MLLGGVEGALVELAQSSPAWAVVVLVAGIWIRLEMIRYQRERNGGDRTIRILEAIQSAVEGQPSAVLAAVKDAYPQDECREGRETMRDLRQRVKRTEHIVEDVKESLDRGLQCPIRRDQDRGM